MGEYVGPQGYFSSAASEQVCCGVIFAHIYP